MSMNLYITFDGRKQEVYQTPTHITYMCLMTDSGFSCELKGKNARRSVRCYVEYLMGSCDGIYYSQEEYDDHVLPIRKHAKEILDGLEKAKKVVAYTL